MLRRDPGHLGRLVARLFGIRENAAAHGVHVALEVRIEDIGRGLHFAIVAVRGIVDIEVLCHVLRDVNERSEFSRIYSQPPIASIATGRPNTLPAMAPTRRTPAAVSLPPMPDCAAKLLTLRALHSPEHGLVNQKRRRSRRSLWRPADRIGSSNCILRKPVFRTRRGREPDVASSPSICSVPFTPPARPRLALQTAIKSSFVCARYSIAQNQAA